ncbi:unnamed protein product [Phytomonas sp. Hart1]|nr:unnamed protein product [Phytomonas sp. Hart1]|eukprot:CCW69417.1 unnamed protein product [Phytomonas sp. isolate Hart1]
MEAFDFSKSNDFIEYANDLEDDCEPWAKTSVFDQDEKKETEEFNKSEAIHIQSSGFPKSELTEEFDESELSEELPSPNENGGVDENKGEVRNIPLSNASESQSTTPLPSLATSAFSAFLPWTPAPGSHNMASVPISAASSPSLRGLKGVARGEGGPFQPSEGTQLPSGGPPVRINFAASRQESPPSSRERESMEREKILRRFELVVPVKRLHR